MSAVAEAMATGLPVIVSNNVGIKDIIKDGKSGFIVPVMDTEILKERILYFYENRDEIKRMGKNSRKQIEKYSWERFGDKLFINLKQVL
ncbi:glycosyltransferase [Methanocaldococcus indicus]|uniref:glycosyltransferase n=1 Tax=Methanocaldococcus indicus TaxID=213231 RepID=UPI003C6D54AB